MVASYHSTGFVAELQSYELALTRSRGFFFFSQGREEIAGGANASIVLRKKVGSLNKQEIAAPPAR